MGQLRKCLYITTIIAFILAFVFVVATIATSAMPFLFKCMAISVVVGIVTGYVAIGTKLYEEW